MWSSVLKQEFICPSGADIVHPAWILGESTINYIFVQHLISSLIRKNYNVHGFFFSFSENTDPVRLHNYGFRAEEIIFILIVVAVWIVAMVFFYKQWDSIRILQPIEPRYKHTPKNLESIRIVKRPQDSVIYKNYSRKLSITMDEREKRRLQRMNTEPVLPSVSRLSALPTVHMEEATTEMWCQFPALYTSFISFPSGLIN